MCQSGKNLLLYLSEDIIYYSQSFQNNDSPNEGCRFDNGRSSCYALSKCRKCHIRIAELMSALMNKCE